MNSKIVILTDSVILYQHYISDEAWESVMAFPRGGLTYLIKNNNIKFYAYIDYFYRNCLMTMDLPIYIVDEEMGIDGEYDDIEEITGILNRIFPANDNSEGIDLTPYLKKREAEETYQPIGLYFDEVEYDSSGKTIDFYSDGALVDSIDATDFIKDGMVDQVELIELSGDTYLHIVFNTDAGKEPIDIPLGDLFDADNYYTKQETDDLLDDKLDASAYTPVDLTDYYTKQEVDDLIPEVPSLDGYATETWVQNQGYINQIKTINNISLIGEGNIQIGSGGTIDAYTKEEADNRFQPKGDYVTTTTFNTYILNLTQQITSLQEAIEACCSGQTGETLYRWITLTGPNDYICSGTTKYAKEQKQQSTDNGATWQNVSPAEYRTGSAIETQSTDCGYTPEPQYRWKAAPASDYMCSGTSKYYKVYYEVSYDNGVTWEHVVPEQTKRGNLIESASTDCGYIEYQYRWYQAPASDYMCSGTTKYYKEYYQVSTDGGNTWTNVSPTQTRQGSVIETQSTDCGYIEPQYRWQDAPNSDYICSGTTKYKKQYYQVSYDGGTTWQNVTPEQTRPGSVIETESTDCGYIIGTKIVGLKNNNRLYAFDCDGEPINTGETYSSATRPYSVDSITIGECVTQIGGHAFQECRTLTNIGGNTNNVALINYSAFERCYGLTSISFQGLTAAQNSAFSNCSGLTSISLPNVVVIGSNAFQECALTTITLPKVANIWGLAFSHNTGLTTVTIGDRLVELQGSAFRYCTALTSVTINSTTPPDITNVSVDNMATQGPFANTPIDGGNGYIYVPAQSVNAYKTAQYWSYYASHIQAIP